MTAWHYILEDRIPHNHHCENIKSYIIWVYWCLLYKLLKLLLHSANFSWPPLESTGQSFWLQIQRSQVWFPALPDLLRSSGFGTRSTQPHEDNWGATWRKSRLRSRKPRLMTVGIHCADHATPSIHKSCHYFANKRRWLGRYSSLADQNHGV
jgi:hypothetical protein